FAAPLTAIGRVRARVLTAALGTDADAIDAGTAPIDGIQVTQPVQDDLVYCAPDAELLPLPQAAPAGHAAAVAELLRQIGPAQAVPQDEQDAAERGTVRNARRTAVVARRFGWEERKNRLPKVVADGVGAGHRRAYPAGHADRKGHLPLSGSLK